MIHRNKLRSGLLYSGALLSALLLSLPGQAGELEARVLNSKGELVAQAVVYARPLAASVEAGDSRDAVIEQVDKEFAHATYESTNHSSLKDHGFFLGARPFEDSFLIMVANIASIGLSWESFLKNCGG